MVDNSAADPKDTIVGLEFRADRCGGDIADGGAATAAPVPLEADGVPTLSADLSEIHRSAILCTMSTASSSAIRQRSKMGC